MAESSLLAISFCVIYNICLYPNCWYNFLCSGSLKIVTHTVFLLFFFLSLNFFMLYPCSICNILIKNDAIFFNFCELRAHPKYNRLNAADVKRLVQTDLVFSCYKCNCTLFPLNTDDCNCSSSSNTQNPNFDNPMTRSQFYENSEWAFPEKVRTPLLRILDIQRGSV